MPLRLYLWPNPRLRDGLFYSNLHSLKTQAYVYQKGLQKGHILIAIITWLSGILDFNWSVVLSGLTFPNILSRSWQRYPIAHSSGATFTSLVSYRRLFSPGLISYTCTTGHAILCLNYQ